MNRCLKLPDLSRPLAAGGCLVSERLAPCALLIRLSHGWLTRRPFLVDKHVQAGEIYHFNAI